MTIDAYVAAVRRELGPRADPTALADLRAQLDELAAESGEAQAWATLGDPRDYAAALREDAEGGAGDDDVPRFLGMPNTLGQHRDNSWSRMFDPSNPNILIPKGAGLGWSINFGALLVRVGLLRPDDVGSDVLGEIRIPDLASAFLLPAAALVATVGAAWWGLGHLHLDRVPVHWDWATPNGWSPAAPTFATYVAVTAGIALLSLVAACVCVRLRRAGAALAIAAVASWASVFMAIPALLALAGERPIGWLYGIGSVVALLLAMLAPLPPIRLAIHRLWRRQGAHRGQR